MALRSLATGCKSADVLHETSKINYMHDFEVQTAALHPSCPSNDWGSEEIPAPTRFLRRQRGTKGLIAPPSCVKDNITCCNTSAHTAHGVGEDMWSFLGPSTLTHGMQSKYYSAHRKHVATLLASSDAAQDDCRPSDGWDEALHALS